MNIAKNLILAGTLIALPGVPRSADAQEHLVATAINQLGLDVLRASTTAASSQNALLSPYSITSALAMAYAGADGATREEMRRVLHLAGEDAAIFGELATLARQLRELQEQSRRNAEMLRQRGGAQDVIEINIANRLFAQSGYPLRPTFTNLLRDQFGAPLAEVEFRRAADVARLEINTWVAGETRDRIRDLIPSGALDATTRAVLVNAIYLKAPWLHEFESDLTQDQPFWANGTTQVNVPTMRQQESLRYLRRNGFTLLGLPYLGGNLQLLILLPDERDGLRRRAGAVTTTLLAEGAKLPSRDVILHLPKFKLKPPALALGERLRGLGMKTAFDQPSGSANFDRMAPRTPDEYLAVSEVFHQAWLSLNEKGTEAAAATAVVMGALSAAPMERPPPVEVRVDRPFLFAIQHVPTGTCLFLGQLLDPR